MLSSSGFAGDAWSQIMMLTPEFRSFKLELLIALLDFNIEERG
jgi:hypothetical protein